MIAPGELSVVLVTYNSAHVVGAALSSLPPGCQLICVDNASKDDLGSALAGFDVALIRNSVNRGYGAACNQGAREATGQFVLFMNPDVTFEPGAIRALLDAARRYPDCRTFVPRTHTSDGKLWFDDRSGTDRMLGRHREVATTKLGGDCCVRFADGGAFMIDRELFLDIGGFDEGFLLYYEDDDLSHRLVQRGEPIIVVDDAVAIHAVGTSVALGRRGVISRNRAKKNSEIHFKTKYGVPLSRARRRAASAGEVDLLRGDPEPAPFVRGLGQVHGRRRPPPQGAAGGVVAIHSENVSDRGRPAKFSADRRLRRARRARPIFCPRPAATGTRAGGGRARCRHKAARRAGPPRRSGRCRRRRYDRRWRLWKADAR